MPTPTKGARLGGSAAHQKIILANLATQLFEHGKITTTEAKARRLRPLAEKLITKAKRGDIHSRRLVLTTVKDKGVVHVLFTEIAPTFAEREGGYTRITKIGPRKGDNAPMAVIELVTESVEDSRKANAKTAGPARSSSARKAPAKTAAPAPPLRLRRPADSPVEESPAEELVGDTEERDEATSEQEQPSDDTSAEEAAEYGEGSYRGSEPPAGYDIKGNENSMKYHTPESPYYDQTIAEVWFNTAGGAVRPPASRRPADLRVRRLPRQRRSNGCSDFGLDTALAVCATTRAGRPWLVSAARAESPSCCSAGWPRPGPRWPRPGRATPNVTGSPRCCGTRRPTTWRSSSPTCPAACGSGAPASAGAPCSTPRRPLPSRRSRSPRWMQAFAAMAELSGPGSSTARADAVRSLFARATTEEQQFLFGLVSGELRQGAMEAAVQDGLAVAYGVPLTAVRRAAMLLSSTTAAAAVLLHGGLPALEAVGLQVGTGIQPMLAASAPDPAAAVAKTGLPVLVDHKLDGVRVQVHRDGDAVRIFTRSLDDITARLPGVVEAVRALPQTRLVLDGEVLALGADGRPEVFQVVASRAMSEVDPAGPAPDNPLRVFFFDLLHTDGRDLLDTPLQDRLTVMRRCCPRR